MNLPNRKARKGQPLLVLVMVLVGWIGVRSILWASSAIDGSGEIEQGASTSAAPAFLPRLHEPERERQGQPADPSVTPKSPVRPMTVVPLNSGNGPQPLPTTRVSPRVAAGHRLLFLVGVSAVPAPQVERAAGFPRDPVRLGTLQLPPRGKTRSRWSADAWVFWRQGGNGRGETDSGSAAAGLGPRAYGASQAGLVLRYRLEPDDPRQATLYLRASGGMDRPHGAELAAGVAMRPLVHLPLALLGEVRAMRHSGALALLPSVAVVSELPVIALPLGLRGEAYGQAGWVGGKDQTPFIDGQIRVDRQVGALGGAGLSIGAGAWAGAQAGSNRFDMGPGLRLDLPLGGTNARFAADYRWRLAGHAAPGSGTAITFSAGF